MSLFIGFRCHPTPPPEAVAALSRSARITRDRMDISVADIDTWRRVARYLRDNGIRIISPLSLADSAVRSWERPADHWVGAVLDYDDSQVGSNPPSDFDPPVRPPERGGYVAFERDLLLERIPKGHVASVADNRICSARMIDALGGERTGRFGGAVIYQERPLTEWHRFEPLERCAVLDKLSVSSEVPCALCGAPHVPQNGIWIANADVCCAIPVAEDVIGYDHYAMTHPVVLSLELAIAVTKRFRGKGYTLEPIYQRDSAITKTIEAVLTEAASLRA